MALSPIASRQVRNVLWDLFFIIVPALFTIYTWYAILKECGQSQEEQRDVADNKTGVQQSLPVHATDEDKESASISSKYPGKSSAPDVPEPQVTGPESEAPLEATAIQSARPEMHSAGRVASEEPSTTPHSLPTYLYQPAGADWSEDWSEDDDDWMPNPEDKEPPPQSQPKHLDQPEGAFDRTSEYDGSNEGDDWSDVGVEDERPQDIPRPGASLGFHDDGAADGHDSIDMIPAEHEERAEVGYFEEDAVPFDDDDAACVVDDEPYLDDGALIDPWSDEGQAVAANVKAWLQLPQELSIGALLERLVANRGVFRYAPWRIPVKPKFLHDELVLSSSAGMLRSNTAFVAHLCRLDWDAVVEAHFGDVEDCADGAAIHEFFYLLRCANFGVAPAEQRFECREDPCVAPLSYTPPPAATPLDDDVAIEDLECQVDDYLTSQAGLVAQYREVTTPSQAKRVSWEMEETFADLEDPVHGMAMTIDETMERIQAMLG